MAWDFSELSDAELATLKTNILAKLNGLLTGSKSGALDGMAFSEMSLDELMGVQEAVNMEQRLRSDTTGDMIGAEFEEASS